MASNEENIRTWLKQAKNLALNLVKRVAVKGDLCPTSFCGKDPENRAALEKELIKVNDQIHEQIESMRQAEAQTGVGVTNLLDEHAKSDSLFCAAVLLVLSRVSNALDTETRDISHLCQNCDPCAPETLEIRDAFRAGGVLRGHVRITSPDTNIDYWSVQLHEASLNAVFNRESTPEEIALTVLPRELFHTRRM